LLLCRREHRSRADVPPCRDCCATTTARVKPISPTTMRKSLPEGEGSSDILEAFAGYSGAMHRFQKGIPFNWGPYFYGVHNRNPDGSDGGTEPHAEHTDSAAFCKALPPGARWITVRPNGLGTDGHPSIVRKIIGYDCNVCKSTRSVRIRFSHV
jgi:hypothetical protein